MPIDALEPLSAGEVLRSCSPWGRPHRAGGVQIGLLVRRVARQPLESAGLAPSPARAGNSERTITSQTGRRSVTPVRRHIREGELFADNAAAAIGLYTAVKPSARL
jgi:hypothetical protein